MRTMINKYAPFLFHPHVLSIVGAAFLPFLLGAAVYAEDINNRSDRGSILGDRLSTNRASAGSSHSCLECKPGYAASGEYDRMASGGTEDAEVAAMELDLSSGATGRAKEGSTSTPAFRCPETTPVTEALTGAGLINLFVSLGIVTVEKAMEACRSLARETISSIPTGDGAFRFSRPLAEGMAGPDVRELQRFLNAQGFALSEEGSGSPGNETEVFGDLTVDAVKRYQATYSAEILDPEGLSAPSGVFGPSSIKKANEILSARKYARPRDGHRPSALK
jgi:Putative peptidoglycan binding domain